LPAAPAKPNPTPRPVRHAPAVRPAGRAPHVPGLPDPPQFYRLDDLEVFAVGEHLEGTPGGPKRVTWTADQLRAMERNFKLQAGRPRGRIYSTVASVPIGDPDLPDLGIDHDEFQTVLNEIGAPNAGLIEDLHFDEASGVLFATAGRVLPPVAEAVRDGKLVAVSGEVYDQPPPGVPGEGPCFMRASLLGHQMPGNKLLKPPPTPTPDCRVYSEGGKLAGLRRPARTPHVFAEARTVAKTAAHPLRGPSEQMAAAKLGLSPETIAAIPDDALGMIITDLGAAEAGEPDAGGDGGATGAPARTPETDAAIMAADPTQTADTLKAMDDPAYWALFTAKTGQPAPTGGAKPMQYSEAARRQPAPPIDAKAFAAEVTRQVLAELDPAVKSVKAQADAVHKFSEQQAAAAKNARVDAVVNAALRAGALTPADNDDAGGTILPLRARLKLLDDRTPAHKFSEKATGKEVAKTLLDLELDRLERETAAALNRPHRFGECLPQTPGAADPKQQAKADYKAWYDRQYPQAANGKAN
jgi:hypothetical protein